MIYTVECSYTDPATEAEWNDFYTLEKLPALMSVSAFHTAQRFEALNQGCPFYFAIYTIDGLKTLQGDEYFQKGGGNFARWQQHIDDWHRNLYDGIDSAPSISGDEYLVSSVIGPEPLTEIGLAPLLIQAIALEKNPERRWLARAQARQLDMEHLPAGIHAYKPMTAQVARNL